MADNKTPVKPGPTRTVPRPRFSAQSVLRKVGLGYSGGRNVIGLQMCSGLLRIIEIDRGAHPPRVINFSSIDPLMDNPQEAADQILGLMREKGITATVVHSVICEIGVEHRQVALPILGRTEMQAIVRREIKKIVPDSSGRDVVFDFWYDRSIKRSGRKAEVLIGVAPREAPARIIGLMELIERDTQLISTVPLTLISALGALGEKTANRITAMVHLERDRSFLVISNRGNWVFSRDFQSVLTREETQAPESSQLQARRSFASARYLADQERLLIEVNRSLLYFKQRFRGEGVSLVVMSGEAFNLEQIAGAIGKNIGLEAIVFNPISAFQVKHLGDRAEKLARIIPSLALPIGAALQTVKDARLNFVPPDYLNRRATRLRRLLMTTAAAVLVLLMSAGYLMVRHTRLDLERVVSSTNQQQVLADLTRRLDEIAEIKTERTLAETRSQFLKRFSSGQGAERRLLIALSCLVPDSVVLYNLKVDRDKNNLLEIVGQVAGQDLGAQDSTFNLFYNRLRTSGLYSGLQEPVTTSRKVNDKADLSFKIDGTLRD
jgi:Tfp pilus assembly PilM family ATPase